MLFRPRRLTDERWGSIELHLARLTIAEESKDSGLIVGLAKDLVETVSKVVCAQLSVPGPAESEVRAWLRTAQDAVAGRVGTGDAGQTRKLLAIMAKGLIVLVEARNQVGSGHGHVTVPDVQAEDALAAADFARAWSQWILRMVDRALEDRVGDLVDRLVGGGTFWKGDLAAALRDLDLPSLDPDDQRRVGVAVGRRSLGETANVIREGVHPLRSRQSFFPKCFQRGLAEGLLFDEEGRLADFRGFEGDVGSALAYVASPDADEVLEAVTAATWSQRLTMSEAVRSDLSQRLREAAPMLPMGLRAVWLSLADRMKPALEAESHVGPDDDNWNDGR